MAPQKITDEDVHLPAGKSLLKVSKITLEKRP